ncbi:protein of unknown function [Azospirillum baldaniorum]|uniref:Uncharacterized protein n=1 Tax=Azospirillum baldaniorum TaxID=1064539 RepID=A0A9P1JSG1_9PROT|nr:protein of unknown function [Azospirillum baldaniorum]
MGTPPVITHPRPVDLEQYGGMRRDHYSGKNARSLKSEVLILIGRASRQRLWAGGRRPHLPLRLSTESVDNCVDKGRLFPIRVKRDKAIARIAQILGMSHKPLKCIAFPELRGVLQRSRLSIGF